MSGLKATPGPWFHDGAGLIYGQVGPDADESPFVADIAFNGIGEELTETELANAHLIEAAPDLYEALELALDMLANYTPTPTKCHEALDKARGAK